MDDGCVLILPTTKWNELSVGGCIISLYLGMICTVTSRYAMLFGVWTWPLSVGREKWFPRRLRAGSGNQ